MPNAHVSLHLRYLPSLFKVVTVCNTLPSLANSVQHFFSIVDICWPLQGLWPVRLFVPLSPALALYKGREGSLFCAGYSLKVSRKDTEEWLKDSSREYLESQGALERAFWLVGDQLQTCRAALGKHPWRHSQAWGRKCRSISIFHFSTSNPTLHFLSTLEPECEGPFCFHFFCVFI